MQTIFLDFETYYDDEYSLRKMTPVEYVLDPRFECQGCGIQIGVDGVPYWLDGPDLPAFFASLDPQRTHLVTHNYLFDGCIVAWRFGFVPRLMTDTLGIARALFQAFVRSCSLDSIAKYLNLGVKGKTLIKVKGMSLAAIKAQPALYAEFKEYGVEDVRLCAGIYAETVMKGLFPPDEMVIMDSVLRMAVSPHFQIDRHVLALHAHNIEQEKNILLAKAMLTSPVDGKSDLMSNDRFAELLENLGVDPPTKVSLVTQKVTWAFAKTDPGFIELEEHENEQVQFLVAARLGFKSTMEETRTKRFQSISNLVWPGNMQELMPIAIKYSGAHTHRLSGDWKLNQQNLRRGGELRKSLVAPDGYVVYAIDSSQIEARGVVTFSGQWDVVRQFANGEDVYSSFASEVFGVPVTKQTHPNERFVGKTGVLGLGFGLGDVKFGRAVRVGSKLQLGTAIPFTDEQSKLTVETYRRVNHCVKAMWKTLNNTIIPAMHRGDQLQLGPIRTEKNAIVLPNGLRLFYHDLHFADGEWHFVYAGKPQRLYGGKLMENIIQALARLVVMQAMLRIQKRCEHLGVRLALQVHDELVFVIHEEHLDFVRAVAMEEMTRPVSWWPGLPLAAEEGWGPNYGEAK